MGAELSELNLWLVHDWLTAMRGGEKILLELVRMFPRARIATLVHVPGTTHPELDKRVAQVSFLQRMPGGAKGFRNYLPLFPRAIRSLKLDGPCDLVISVSHAVAKSVCPPSGPSPVPHICYCNTPMRYVWGMEDVYFGKVSPKRMAVAMVAPSLRRFDRQTGNVTEFLANSVNVAGRIRRCYGRESTVVYAGIDHEFFVPAKSGEREDFYLCAGALVGYKRVDLAVKACLETGRKLKIIGKGPEEKRLKQLAGGSGARNVEFFGYQSDDVLREHYQRCRGFVFAGEEDFGLTPVEAQACGAPVIAYAAGGAMETVIDRQTGLFFGEQTVPSLTRAMDRLEEHGVYSAQKLKANALRFTWEGFREGVTVAVERCVHHHIPGIQNVVTTENTQGMEPPVALNHQQHVSQ